jgi:hypothetical protein
MTQDTALALKQQQFNAAMELYEKNSTYTGIGKLVSVLNVSLQVYLLYLVLPLSLGWPLQVLAFFTAYLAADFLNGLIHMYMDNNESYDSPAGPMIAAFHLHHRTPLYKKNPLPIVYFNESGRRSGLENLWLRRLIIDSVPPVVPRSSCMSASYLFCGSHALCCHVPDTRMTRS